MRQLLATWVPCCSLWETCSPPGRRFVLRPTLLHHPLRFKHHLPMVLVELWAYLTCALRVQLAAIELYQVQSWVRPACRAIDTAVLSMLPTVNSAFAQLCDDQHAAARLVMVFCYVAIALLFSINFIYWEVRTSSAALVLAAVAWSSKQMRHPGAPAACLYSPLPACPSCRCALAACPSLVRRSSMPKPPG
jgi:hypothetical protein